MTEPGRSADRVPTTNPTASEKAIANAISSSVLAMALRTSGQTSWPLRTSDVPRSPVTKLPSHVR